MGVLATRASPRMATSDIGALLKKFTENSPMPSQQTTTLRKDVQATLKRLEKKDPGLRQFLDDAYGYAVFPSVGKAALVIGGAYGKGAVFEDGEMVGYA